MRRRGRRALRLPVVRRGDMIVDGRVQARLLGLPLLDIDAHVVVARAGDGTAPGVIETDERVLGGLRADGSAPPELARAVRLLAEGSSALDDARRLSGGASIARPHARSARWS
jgi:hypothetical protein